MPAPVDRVRLASAIGVLVVAACGSGHPQATATSSPVATGARSTGPVATSARTEPPAVSTVAFSCTSTPHPGQFLVLAKLAGSNSMVVRDVSNLDNPTTLCTFASAPYRPRFVSPTRIVYSAGDSLEVADLSTQRTSTWGFAGPSPSSLEDFAAAGNGSIMYLVGHANNLEWRLSDGAIDRLIQGLPAVYGRGGVIDYDSTMLGYSADGRYMALVTTYSFGPNAAVGEDAPFEIRDAAGHLVFSDPAAGGSASAPSRGPTMATWAPTGATLYYRDQQGVWSWDPVAGNRLILPGVQWVSPHFDPSGNWIAYSIGPGGEMHNVEVYQPSNGATTRIAGPGRNDPKFLAPGVLWYRDEVPCPPGPCGHYTVGADGFIWQMPNGPELPSRIVDVYDTFPHTPASSYFD